MASDKQKVLDEAVAFIRSCCAELGKTPEEAERRIDEIINSIEETGTYRHTYEELQYGARASWRNNARCIGRLFWPTLEVFDERALDDEELIAQALMRHIGFATNNGRIRPSITVFAPASHARHVRIWNHQLIRYAGYETEDGIVGDPASVEFTKQCLQLGWEGARTPFDVLPLVVQIDGKQPKWFRIPSELVLEVPLIHPAIERFAGLGLRWYAVPIISDMRLEIGGIQYTAAPFNGWYMETEIGARNLSDVTRYNQLPAIADLMGLDRSTNASLWKDRALVELNAAVLHSFKSRGVSIVDHHTASEQFMRFQRQEADAGREVNGKWSWLIPPMSPTATPIWDYYFTERELSPNYSYQPLPYSAEEKSVDVPSGQSENKENGLTIQGCPFHMSSQRP
ncbi:nitric oxide synthase oxygenase [Paenibacillus sp. NPDC056579]|uniref:nitric oxide synthase oxygenase n=1 Tax=Paenibacillus sp. NPDC056579 TaxID=3345871 RepID=UPI00368FFA1D